MSEILNGTVDCRLLTNKRTNKHTDKQTNKQTNGTENITSFDFVGGGNKSDSLDLAINAILQKKEQPAFTVISWPTD